MWGSAKRAHLHPRFAKSPGKHQPTTVVGSHSGREADRQRSVFPQRVLLLCSLHALRVTGEMHDRSSRCMPQTATKALEKKELMAARDGHRSSLRRCVAYRTKTAHQPEP